MGQKLIFLSHIHEEKDLAILIKDALEDEFSGFVDIFVSSDGVSIPAGSNFLKRIESALVECSAALFLISPSSINRNWINFELGAVWIKNKIHENNGLEIPAIPICHSGMDLKDLPQPINLLNAIQGNIASQLEFAFRSIQAAVGGKGKLRTDFDELAFKIQNFERLYTLGSRLLQFLKLFAKSTYEIYDLIDKNLDSEKVQVGLGQIEQSNFNKLCELAKNLEGHVSLESKPMGLIVDTNGTWNLVDVEILFNTATMIEFRDILEY